MRNKSSEFYHASHGNVVYGLQGKVLYRPEFDTYDSVQI